MQTPKLRSVIRLDSKPLDKAYFTSEGFLRDKPVLTSTGIFEYSNPDGTIRRELRLPEDVFAPESLKSYKGKPVIITHDAGLIDKDNVAENQIGTILSEGERSGDDVRAEIVIHDTDAMKEAGLRELSLGYSLDLDETAGEWHGQHYDAIQKNIRINHLALVKEARAGEQARLNLDGRDQKNALKGGKRSMATRKTYHGDDVLSQEEFNKAIDEYKERRSQREQADAEDDEVMVEEEKTPDTIEDKVAVVKANRDRRDEEGDPADEEEALSTIAHQDEDIDTLFDIIDTLLAERDFGKDEKSPVSGVDEMEKTGNCDEDVPEDEELPPVDDEEEVAQDADDEEEIPAEDEEEEDLITDAEEEGDEILDEEDIDDEDRTDGCGRTNMDAAISRSIREHMMLGNLGRKVGLRNLEMSNPMTAKKAIIAKVRPEMRLDGKSATYINAAFEMAKADIKDRKSIGYQKKQMFNADSAREVSSADNARQRMIERQHKK